MFKDMEEDKIKIEIESEEKIKQLNDQTSIQQVENEQLMQEN